MEHSKPTHFEEARASAMWPMGRWFRNDARDFQPSPIRLTFLEPPLKSGHPTADADGVQEFHLRPAQLFMFNR
jgi:hypothetical protein